jgi:hypothetical protein
MERPLELGDDAPSPTSVVRGVGRAMTGNLRRRSDGDGRAGHFQLRNTAEQAVVADQAANDFGRLPRGDCAHLHRELEEIRRLEGA